MALNGATYRSIDYVITCYDTTCISSRDGALAAKEKDFIFEKYLPYIYNNQKDKFIFSMFKNNNRRIKYLEKIEKTRFIRKTQLIICFYTRSLFVLCVLFLESRLVNFVRKHCFMCFPISWQFIAMMNSLSF